MRDNDVSVKKSSIFSRMFGAVHRAALRCVAMVVVPVSVLFSFDMGVATAAGTLDTPEGVAFLVSPTTGVKSVTMVFNFSGTLLIRSGLTSDGVSGLSNTHCKFTDTNANVSASGDTFVLGTNRSVTCTFPDTQSYIINLVSPYEASIGITAYADTSSLTVSTVTSNISLSTFRFSANAARITGIAWGSLGNVFYTLKSSATGGVQPIFMRTFYGATGLTSINNDLFGVSGATATGNNVHINAACLISRVGGGLCGQAANFMFYQTFYNTRLTQLPSRGTAPYGLFRGLTPARGMFYATFRNVTSLISLNSDIFYDMGTTPADYMFYYMFAGCSNTSLTSVPSGFFSQFSTSNPLATYLFGYTFYGCTGLTTITGAFTSVNGGTATTHMFRQTFYGCNGLQTVPSNLFSGFTSTADYMFYETFRGCIGLTALNNNIFGTTAITSDMANYLFGGMFFGCTGITSVMDSFFSRFTGKPGNYMFNKTFYGCTNLATIGSSATSHIFTGVGSAVTGSNRVLGQYMFYQTFRGCTALAPGAVLIFSPFDNWTAAVGAFAQTFYNCTGSTTLNANLFSKIVGNPEIDLFYQTFYGCTGITGSVPKDFFAGLRGSAYTNTGAFSQMFYGCTGLGNNGTYFIPPELFYGFEKLMWSGAVTPVGGNVGQVTNMFYNTGLMTECPIGYSEYTISPYSVWTKSIMGGKAVCEPTMPTTKFSMTLTALNAGDIFAFGIVAKGDFYVRWGDGAPVEKISAANLTIKNFSHTYISAASDGTITIELSSENVTGYTTSHTTSNASSGTLNFSPTNGATSKTKIKSMGGSLGALFPTYGAGTSLGQQPFFAQTFSGATALESIPSGLFNGLTGDISSSGTYMFYRTFYGCTKLIGGIPENLFGNLSGTIPIYMFYQTFKGCTNLGKNSVGGTTSYYIPPRLFMNFTKWSGTAATHMSQIFGDTGLATTSTTCSGFADAPYQFYTGYESTSTNGFNGKISCFNGLTITTNSISSFSFGLAAGGNFYVGWGDDKFDVITRASATQMTDTISHTYEASGTRTIQIGGLANAYYRHSTSTVDSNTAGTSYSVISFYNNTTITGLSGSLMLMFPSFIKRVMQLGGGYEFLFYTPYFPHTFRGCTNLTSLPSSLFAGASVGVTTPYMFYYTFQGDTGLTSIPGDLFSSITGNASTQMFGYAFYGCSGVTSLPANLFSYIGTTPGRYMFAGTFINTSITSIPTNFFSRFDGQVPSAGMFHDTFQQTNLTQVPNVFKNLSGDISSSGNAFHRTFKGCTRMYGELPSDMFENLTGTIPDRMFYQTFYGCTNLGKNAVGGTSTYYIPSTFFGGIIPNANATTPTTDMFAGTGLLTECPGVLNQYFTGFETFVDGSNSPKVSCKRCAYLPGQASYGNTCYNLCNLNGDNMTKLHVGDNWFHLFAQSEATNFAHHLNFKYGNNANDICFVPLNSGLDNANSGSLNFNDGGSQRYHAKRSGTTSRAGGEQSKTKSVATEPEQKTKQ